MTGVENFLCSCGLLVGFDFLDQAESPAHALATVVQHFPLLPNIVFFITACQHVRNAQRRLPWLFNTSQCHCFVDRLHNVGDQHKCSCVFDANKYPSLCRKHRSACADSRHALNKAFKMHLTHLRQDHCIVQMRMLAAVINLRVMMRGVTGTETNHRPMAKFFRAHVVKHCERTMCICANWLAHGAETQTEQDDAGDGDEGGSGAGGGGCRGSGGGGGFVPVSDDAHLGRNLEGEGGGVDLVGGQEGMRGGSVAGSNAVEGEMMPE
eukprot:TRINITY_DN855_c0_g1_i2.p1 TRINITY_DN855_c0_g1~~TRINITY_DN855_c0_g1_i2.p1  ORF type:complete len:266 (-),score=24.99 TRINITY_DN855_c0_g1_i2:651-1448(-)